MLTVTQSKIKVETITQIKSRIWKINMRTFSPKFRSVRFFCRWDILRNDLPRFIELCMETNRNIVIEFYYEREQSSLKTSYLLKTALIIMQGMLREKKNSIATPNLACTQTLFYFSFCSVRARLPPWAGGQQIPHHPIVCNFSQEIFKDKCKGKGILVHVMPSNFFSRILKSEALVYSWHIQGCH